MGNFIPAFYAAMSDYEHDYLKDDRQQHEKTRQTGKFASLLFAPG